MLFNSVPFLLLVLPTFLLYYLPFMRRFQLQLLIISSFIFYAWSMPWLLSLLVFSLAINVASSHAVVHGAAAMRRTYATLGVVANLAILVFFKYSPLVGRSFFPEGSGVGEFLISIP
ncbi:MAG TPA: hypothetical protein PKJ19_15940, partial [Flavobacteriales bacterium]|nr:hypothetical protein [Flavobacteriales bacterium]